jgi:hypothetical protein
LSLWSEKNSISIQFIIIVVSDIQCVLMPNAQISRAKKQSEAALFGVGWI